MENVQSRQRDVKYQYFAAMIINILTFSFSSGDAWFGPAQPVLTEKNTSPLESGALTVENVSWIGSILCIGAIVGNLLSGFLLPRIGSKTTVLLLGIPQLVN